MPKYDGAVTISTALDNSSLEKSVAGLGDKLKSGFSAAWKVASVAIGATTAAVGSLVKQSVDGYSNFEQLVGGVETLFKSSADAVMGYANNAYKTAGLSANEYMETVTSFSARLLQGLGGDTARAAQLADQAIVDMADNANKMGTDIESIQNAYQGFAKQNYTLLDNLKLGYGGTQAEMVRLINDSGILSEKIDNLDNVSFDQVIEAIHAVQTNMGITGTTAQEAATTIQGSVSSMKSAWENLVTGLADENADMDTLIGDFVDSVATVGENITPVVETTLSSVGDLIAKLAPTIGAEIPSIITEVLPSLLEAGVQLIQGIVEGVMSALPELQAAAGDVFDGLIEYLTENLPQMISVGLEALLSFSEGFRENVGVLVAMSLS